MPKFLHIPEFIENQSVFKVLNYLGYRLKESIDNSVSIYYNTQRLIHIYLDKDTEKHVIIDNYGSSYDAITFFNQYQERVSYHYNLEEQFNAKLEAHVYDAGENPQLLPISFRKFLTLLWKPRRRAKSESNTIETLTMQGVYVNGIINTTSDNVLQFFSAYYARPYFEKNFYCKILEGTTGKMLWLQSASEYRFAKELQQSEYNEAFIYLSNNLFNLEAAKDTQHLIYLEDIRTIPEELHKGYYLHKLYLLSYLVSINTKAEMSFDCHAKDNTVELHFYFREEKPFIKFFSSINMGKSTLKRALIAQLASEGKSQKFDAKHLCYDDGIRIDIDKKKILLSLGFDQTKMLITNVLALLDPGYIRLVEFKDELQKDTAHDE